MREGRVTRNEAVSRSLYRSGFLLGAGAAGRGASGHRPKGGAAALPPTPLPPNLSKRRAPLSPPLTSSRSRRASPCGSTTLSVSLLSCHQHTQHTQDTAPTHNNEGQHSLRLRRRGAGAAGRHGRGRRGPYFLPPLDARALPSIALNVARAFARAPVRFFLSSSLDGSFSRGGREEENARRLWRERPANAARARPNCPDGALSRRPSRFRGRARGGPATPRPSAVPIFRLAAALPPPSRARAQPPRLPLPRPLPPLSVAHRPSLTPPAFPNPT